LKKISWKRDLSGKGCHEGILVRDVKKGVKEGSWL